MKVRLVHVQQPMIDGSTVNVPDEVVECTQLMLLSSMGESHDHTVWGPGTLIVNPAYYAFFHILSE